MIYQYYFGDDVVIELLGRETYYEVQNASGSPHSEKARVLRCQTYLGKYNGNHGLDRKWPTSASAIHLVNRRLYHESLEFLYGAVSIYFQNPAEMYSFSKVVGHYPKLQWITRLHFFQNMGVFSLTTVEDEAWRKRCHSGWARFCTFLGLALPNLERLHIDLVLREYSSLKFSFVEPWATPLFKLGAPGYLKDFQLTIDSSLLQACKYRWHDLVIRNPPHPSNEATHLRMEGYYTLEQMHLLFAEALRKKVLGASDICAVRRYRELCKRQFTGISDETRRLYLALSTPLFGSVFDSPGNWAWVQGGNTGDDEDRLLENGPNAS
jgi:hypothetical protein